MAQTQHALQSAEAARRDGQPRWMQFAALIHDLGKVLCIWGYDQWSVVGDTFPVGCKHDQAIVYHSYFQSNPDCNKYDDLGIYERNCGFDNVHFSFGHDEYLARVIAPHVSSEIVYCIRYHSFYPWHKEGAYSHLASEHDRAALPVLKEFNKYDLYSKSDGVIDDSVKDYYRQLVSEFLPGKIQW